MEEKDIRICPVCNKEVERNDMNFTRDCHGITFRLVCNDCWEKLMEKGYDGEYYSEADECKEDFTYESFAELLKDLDLDEGEVGEEIKLFAVVDKDCLKE